MNQATLKKSMDFQFPLGTALYSNIMRDFGELKVDIPKVTCLG